MPELPVDLIIQILQRLPVKTLLRFRCVCKSIRNIIDSRDFINAHLNTTSDERTHRKLIFPPFVDDDTLRFVVFDIDDSFLQVFDIEPEFEYLPSYNFFAHCNGLILLGEHLFELGVWNPSTRKYKNLPPLQFTDEDFITDFGFGYDSSSDDYKVLLMKNVCTIIKDDDITSTYNFHLEVWILGLRSCYWRMIGKDLMLFRNDYTNITTDGAFHFLCGDKVFAFDLANETFSRISLPNFDQQVLVNDDARLQVFEGCLCISFLSLDKEKHIELYVREKDGVEFSWTKLLSITSENDFGRLLAYSKERDKVFILDDQHHLLYSYDLKEKSLQSIETGDIPYPNGIFFVESLVPVDYEVIVDQV